MNAEMAFDLGPLTWVKSELDSALGTAKKALVDWNGQDTAPLQAAMAHLHQVSGALTIVDLQGVSLLCAETERLLQDMVNREEQRRAAATDTVIDAIDALLAYLDHLMAGGRNAELQLADNYAAVLTQRGAEPPPPSELFFPDVSVRVTRPAADTPPLDDTALTHAIRRARSQYQKGLLLFLQDKEPVAGLMYMDQAVHELEKIAPGPSQYTFWWAVAGFIESLRRGALPVDFWAKRLCGRIDLQMRRLMEGSRQIAERLLRDVLYYLAQDHGTSGRSLDARRIFQLDLYLPAADEGSQAEASWRPHLAALRDALVAAKDHWMKYCSGRRDSLEPFQTAAQDMFEAAMRLPNETLKALLRMVQAVAKRLPSVADTAQNEALQLEMATAMLLVQNAIEHFEALGDEFTRQSDVQTQRLQAAIDPSYDTSRIPTDVPLLDDISRKAQEKLIIAQVTQEITANLSQVEEILDKFFRDAAERSRLPLVPGLMKQILGALNILQLQTAADLTRESLQRITRFADPDYPITPDELNWVADALSTLGLYVDALRYGRDDRQRLASLLARRPAPARAEVSVEEQIEAEIDSVRQLASILGQTDTATATQEALQQGLVKLSRDADLVGDAALREQISLALKLLQASAGVDEIQAAVGLLGKSAIQPATAPSAETSQLAAASAAAIDAEMLAVYIEEANDVLGSVATQLARLQITPFDQDAFTSIRRSFHTLKGSGRMVGLTDLAEVAWEVEQTLNYWLRLERTPTPDLLDLLEQCTNAFGGWIQALETTGWAQVDATDLVARTQRLRGEAEESPPLPKPEAGESASAPAAGGEEALVQIGGHHVALPLLRIFQDEARQRLQDLRDSLAPLAHGRNPGSWESFIRTAHTLAGISRTTGFPPLANSSHALESWAGGWPEKIQPLAESHVQCVADVLTRMQAMLDDIEAGRWPHSPPQLGELLAALPICSVTTGLAQPEEVQPEEVQPEEVQPGVTSQPEEAVALVSQATLAPQGEAETGDSDTAAVALPEPATALAPLTEGAAQYRPATPQILETPFPVHAEGIVHSPHPLTQPIQVDSPAPAEVEPTPIPRDELDAQLLPIFLEEAAELLPRIGENLRRLRAEANDTAAHQALLRALHTLKGSARMAGAMAVGEMTHRVESRLLEFGDAPPEADILDSLEGDYDHIAENVDRLRLGPDHALTTAAAAQPQEAVSNGAPLAPPSGQAAPAQTAVHEDELRLRQTLRLKTNVLDTLLNEAGEVAIARARVENVLSGYRQTTQELSANVERLRTQLRELEIQAESQMRSHLSQLDESHFDPLEFDRYTRLQELTRLLAESVNDVSTAQDNLLSGIDEADRALVLQSRMTRTLQHELMRMRMVPLASLAERLHRVVRQSAKDLGRKAQLEIEGGQTELDRSILDRIAAPLEHLLRNAVAHGVEPPQARLAAGKPEYGEVRLAAKQQGNEIIITVADDGAGVDQQAVRARAEALGWLQPGEEASTERLDGFLFMSGFSTAQEVTEVAGRGIGLDVVKDELAGLGGRVRLDSEPGLGTRFTIRLPLTLAVSPVVLARAGGQIYALPANQVALVKEVKLDDLVKLQQVGYVQFEDDLYPLRSLAELTHCRPEALEGRYRTILLLRSGSEHLALRVDSLEGNYEAVVKNIGSQLARIAGIVGATVLGDGRIALIINPFALAERVTTTAQEVEEIETEEVQPPMVLVVDDSLTMRKITSRLLDREGYRVATAKDGIEALEFLHDEMPAVMLLDIEMPRMDGFEVTRAVRADSRLKQLPIIMITSRTADKHREHALDLGVDAYLGKPYGEAELMGEIHRLLGQPVPA